MAHWSIITLEKLDAVALPNSTRESVNAFLKNRANDTVFSIGDLALHFGALEAIYFLRAADSLHDAVAMLLPALNRMQLASGTPTYSASCELIEDWVSGRKLHIDPVHSEVVHRAIIAHSMDKNLRPIVRSAKTAALRGLHVLLHAISTKCTPQAGMKNLYEFGQCALGAALRTPATYNVENDKLLLDIIRLSPPLLSHKSERVR